MSCEATPEHPRLWLPQCLRSLPVRLTLYYAVVLLVALGVCYGVSYWRVSSLASQRVDAYLSTEADECHHFYELKGLGAVTQEAEAESQAEGSRDVYFRVFDGSGHTLFETASGSLASAPTPAAGRPRRRPMSVGPGGKVPARMIVTDLSPGMSLMIVGSMESDYVLVSQSMSLIFAVMAATWLAAGAIGIAVTRHHLRGISAVTDAATAIADGNITRRAPNTHRGDEIDRLATTFNVMAQRIEILLRNLRDTNDSLAHELRSPLTRMRSRCELEMLHGTGEPGVLAQDVIEQIDHLLGIINTILDMSAFESAAGPQGTPLDLRKLVADACDLFMPVAEDKSVALELAIVDALPVSGNRDQLQRLFSNLLDNALKYTREGGKVRVTGERRQGNVVVAISDTGSGIAADEVSRVFDRFFRGRNVQGQAGTGLGLSLAQIIAISHGGRISVESRRHCGTTFTVQLPLWQLRSGTESESRQRSARSGHV
ncbi:MAG TPA: HAMP domain-containing sensor histidine kinase [Phycisphaerae bacterium]|nr:HAMP domain-containing sensor histidine kinase [Phycisphaerae bacterium]